MLSLKINKITPIWLLLVIFVGYGHTIDWPLMAETEHKIYIDGKSPKVGEVFEVVYRVRLKANISPEFGQRNFWVQFGTGSSITERAEVIGTNEICIPFLIPGEWQEVHGKYRIPKPYKMMFISTFLGTAKGHKYRMVGGCLKLFLIDSLTGQYGTREAEYEGIEYRYEAATFGFMSAPDLTVGELNKKVIAMMRKMEPALSDSEALLLHSEIAQVGAPPEFHPKKFEKGMLPGEEYEEIYKYYLKNGWLKSVREGRHEDWLIQMKDSLKKGGGSKTYFFRPDTNNTANYFGYLGDSQTRSTVTFTGVWRYKDHLYNKDQGLLASAIKGPIPQIKARVLMTYYYYGMFRRVTFDYATTDANGWFQVSDNDVPLAAVDLQACPVIYPSGPNPASPAINVSDPNITIPSYWKDKNDSTLFPMRELGAATMHLVDDSVTGDITFGFDTIWTDTFPQVAQPQSGCINIYETCLRARVLAFINPAPSWPLRVMWEPGYDSTTKYNSADTIFIFGDTTGNDDEWNDDIILHEFGHYLMRHYAKLRSTVTNPHQWYKSYPNDTCLAYQEGWADFFSGGARAGSETDSLIVDTGEGINSGFAGYLNLENPWDYSTEGWNPIDSFQGGPWCQGAVAGALWDIYDSHNEDPYHSYPDTLHGFPDTGLRDTLSMGINPIWNVFDNFDPPGSDSFCSTIYNFRSGWNYYNYDHAFALNQILLHHRIRDTIPAAPTGLSARAVLGDVRLYWHKNSEPDLKGYRVFRRDSTIMNPTPGWTSWALLIEKNTDTTHLDTTTVSGGKYRYRLTAFDSLGNESGYSDSVSILVRGKGDIDKQPPFGLTKTIVRDVQGIEFFIPEGRKEVFVKVYDCCGRIVNKQRIHVGSSNLCGISLKNSRFDHLPSGVYFLCLETDKSDKIVEKFVIMK